MDIRSHLLLENSRKNWNEIISYIDDNQDKFKELMHLFLNDEMRIVQRASQPIGIISEKKPHLIRPYAGDLVKYLKKNPIAAVKRNTMRIFQFTPIPEEIEGELFDIGLTYLKKIDEPIAVKAFTMTVLRKICEKYPSLAQEVIHQIEILVKEQVSSGLTNRGKHELKKLNTLLENN